MAINRFNNLKLIDVLSTLYTQFAAHQKTHHPHVSAVREKRIHSLPALIELTYAVIRGGENACKLCEHSGFLLFETSNVTEHKTTLECMSNTQQIIPVEKEKRSFDKKKPIRNDVYSSTFSKLILVRSERIHIIGVGVSISHFESPTKKNPTTN